MEQDSSLEEEGDVEDLILPLVERLDNPDGSVYLKYYIPPTMVNDFMLSMLKLGTPDLHLDYEELERVVLNKDRVHKKRSK